MISGRIAGATRLLGKHQGYLGLAVRDELVDDSVNGPNTPAMVTAWHPTPRELEALLLGASVYVHLMGTKHPPIVVTVGPVPKDEE